MSELQPQITVADICDRLGRKAIAERVNRHVSAVSNAIADNKFPASWYAPIRAMCVEANAPCPGDLFNFVGDHAAVDKAS